MNGTKTDEIEVCEYLPWDTGFFEFNIARVNSNRLTFQRLRDVLDWCKEKEIKCLYFLADSDHAETVELAEEHGFHLIDIRVTLTRKTGSEGIDPENQTRDLYIRSSTNEDIPVLKVIAQSSFELSRFYYDPGFSREACKAFYETWIERSCTGYADAVFVAELNGQLRGFISCHLSDTPILNRIGLLGVSNQFKGHGLGRELVRFSLNWFDKQGASMVSVVTQGRNVPAQHLYQKCGFLISSVQLWYHKWL